MPGWPLLRLGALSIDAGVLTGQLSLALSLTALGLALAAARRGGLRLLPFALLGLLADNLLLLLGAWAAAGGVAAPLGPGAPEARGGRPSRRALAAGSAVALLLGSALLFWGLGGTWSKSGRYLPDHDPDRPLPTMRHEGREVPLGPTLRLAELAAQLGYSDERGERPVAAALAGKLLYGAPLTAAIGGAVCAAAFLLGALALLPGSAAPLRGLMFLVALSLPLRLLPLLRLCPPLATALAALLCVLLLLGAAPAAAALAPLAGRIDERLCRPALPSPRPMLLLGAPLLLALAGALAGAAALHRPRVASGPRLALDPASLSFPPSGGARTLTLRNEGDRPLRLQHVGLSADSLGFHVEGEAPPSLAPGQATTLTLRYAPAGRRRQAFGALQVHSDDPGGVSDPRMAELLPTRAVRLVAGQGSLLPALLLCPLLGALLSASRGRIGRGAARLLALGALGLALAAAARFDPGLGVRDGGYGVQMAAHLPLWGTCELFLGVDGLSVGLLALCSLLGLCAAVEAEGMMLTLLLLLEAASLAALCALDAALLGLLWLLCLCAAAALLAEQGCGGAAGRLLLPGGVSAVLLLLALGLAVRASLPTPLVDGTPAAHSLDLVKLAYQNHYGHLQALGFPLSKWILALVLLAALAAAGLFPLHGWTQAALGGGSWLPVLTLRVLGIYVLLRLGHGLVPDAAVDWAPLLSALGAAGALWGGLRALGGATVEGAQLFGGGLCLLGAASFTQTGLGGALLLLHGQALGLALLRPGGRPGTLGAVGLLGGWGTVLVLLGALPGARPLVLLSMLALLVLLLADFRARRPASARLPAALCAAALLLLLLFPGAALWPGALSDLLTHTSGHVGAAALAALAPWSP